MTSEGKKGALEAASAALSAAAEAFSDDESMNDDGPYRRLSYMRDEVDELAAEFAPGPC